MAFGCHSPARTETLRFGRVDWDYISMLAFQTLIPHTDTMENKFKRVVKKTDTSWNAVAPWYDDLLAGGGTYQSELILPNALRLLGLKKGEKVLDLACGQGFFSREFAKTGVEVSGVDLSPALIALAKRESPRSIEYGVSAADRLGFLKDASFDAVACILAIQNMKNVTGVCAEAARVLAEGGRFLIVMNHPAFRIPQRSGWGFDEKRQVQYRRVDEYISESEAAIVMNPGSNQKVSTPSFHRPLQLYFKALHKTGLVVTRLEEWTSPRKSEAGPRAVAENKARREFPLFLALLAQKQQFPTVHK